MLLLLLLLLLILLLLLLEQIEYFIHSFSDYDPTESNLKDLLENLWIRLLSTNNIPENSPLYRIWNSEVTVNQLIELYQKRTPDPITEPNHRRNLPESNSFRYSRAAKRGILVEPQLVAQALWFNGSNGHIGMIILNSIHLDDMIENGVQAEMILSETEYRIRYPPQSPVPSSPISKVNTPLDEFLYHTMPRQHGYQYDNEIIRATGDGACFYNSIAIDRYQNEKYQTSVRESVADLFRNEMYIQRRFGSKNDLLARLQVDDSELDDLETYIRVKILSKFQEVDEDAVIYAVADAYNVEIIIWDEFAERAHEFRPISGRTQEKIFLIRRRFSDHSYHYEILKSHRI